MSKQTVAEMLTKIAEDMQESSAWDEIRSVALAKLEQEGMEKSAAEQILTGLESDVEKPQVVDQGALSDILLKTASYIKELEAKIVTSDEALSKVAEEQMVGAMASFIDNGFSPEEARELSSLPEETLQKLASNVEMAPATLGRGAGMDQDSMDPMMAFLMS